MPKRHSFCKNSMNRAFAVAYMDHDSFHEGENMNV